jgi:sulfur carrier protein
VGQTTTLSEAMLHMQIQLNGEPREIDPGTILDLVHALSLDPRKVAVERNLEIVPRSLHDQTALADGDRIEIVQLVGGG